MPRTTAPWERPLLPGIAQRVEGSKLRIRMKGDGKVLRDVHAESVVQISGDAEDLQEEELRAPDDTEEVEDEVEVVGVQNIVGVHNIVLKRCPTN